MIRSSLNNNYAALVGLGRLNLPKTCLPGVVPRFDHRSGQSALRRVAAVGTVTENYTLKDDLSKSMGAHNFKMGYEFLRFHNNATRGPGNPGWYVHLCRRGRTAKLMALHRQHRWHYRLAQFLTGDMSGFSFSRTRTTYTRSWEYSMYFQDDWKVSPILTAELWATLQRRAAQRRIKAATSVSLISTFRITRLYEHDVPALLPAGGCMGAYTHPRDAHPVRHRLASPRPGCRSRLALSSKMVFHAGARIAHTDTFSDGTSLIFTMSFWPGLTRQVRCRVTYNPLFNINNGIPAWSYPALRRTAQPHHRHQRRSRQPHYRPEKFKDAVCGHLEHRHPAGTEQGLRARSPLGRLRDLERFRKHQYQYPALGHDPEPQS